MCNIIARNLRRQLTKWIKSDNHVLLLLHSLNTLTLFLTSHNYAWLICVSVSPHGACAPSIRSAKFPTRNSREIHRLACALCNCVSGIKLACGFTEGGAWCICGANRCSPRLYQPRK
jgi:hypothetical protein